MREERGIGGEVFGEMAEEGGIGGEVSGSLPEVLLEREPLLQQILQTSFRSSVLCKQCDGQNYFVEETDFLNR